MPPVPLFEEICYIERWLLLYNSIHPFTRIPSFADVKASHPILTNAAVVPHVEPNRTFNFTVDDPVTPFDAHITPVEECKWPRHFHAVIHHSVRVNERHQHRFRHILFGLHNLAVGERWFLIILFDKLVFIVAEVYNLVSIFRIKLTFFVHVQYPSIFVQFVVHWAVV